MSRPASQALHVWHIEHRPEGDVRLLAPASGKRSYRVIWRENGLQRERTTMDLDRAMEIGLEVALSLAAVPGEPGPHAPFRDALAHHLDHDARGVTWSVKYERRLKELVRRWMDDNLLDLPCLAFASTPGRAVVKGLLDRLDAAGYPRGTHEYQQMGALLSGTFKSGNEAGYFADSPMTGVRYSISTTQAHGGGRFANVRPVGTEESPPSHRVEDLIAEAPRLTGRWWEGLPAGVMAYGGLRIEEALALEPDHVLADTPGLLVHQQLMEVRHSDNRGKAAVTVTKPKGNRMRETFLHPAVWEQVRRRAEEVDRATPARPGLHRPLFPAPRGGWQRVDNYRHRIFVPAAEAAGWPACPTPTVGTAPGSGRRTRCATTSPTGPLRTWGSPPPWSPATSDTSAPTSPKECTCTASAATSTGAWPHTRNGTGMPEPSALTFTCPNWATTYRDLVDAIERGEDPMAPDQRLVFTPRFPDDGSAGDISGSHRSPHPPSPPIEEP